MPPTSKIGTVYLDMDNVLVDFNGFICDFYHIPESKIDEYWPAILKEIPLIEFFINLKLLPNAMKLIGWLEKNHFKISILSKPLREPDTNMSVIGKKIWLEKHGLGNVHATFDRNKWKYAHPDGSKKSNILIDDDPYNIFSFKKHGGIGLFYRDYWYENVIQELNRFL